MSKYIIQAEYTDTFGGEANYSWVHRVTLRGPLTDLQAMRRAKAQFGLTGVKGRTYKHGDHIEFRPYGICTVMHLTVMHLTVVPADIDPDT